MKCSNCPADAVYAVLDPGISPAYFCNNCLPAYMRPRAEAGQLALPEAPKKKKKAAATEPEEPSEVSDENNES
jgi:hypothetical protein